MKTLMLLAAMTFSDTTLNLCALEGIFAETVMLNRQLQTPLIDAIKMTKGNDEQIEIVLRAYQVTAYSSETIQNEAIASFRNDIELECLMSIATAN